MFITLQLELQSTLHDISSCTHENQFGTMFFRTHHRMCIHISLTHCEVYHKLNIHQCHR